MKSQDRRPIRYEMEREFPMSVAEAWSLLADTDHLNRSVGLPSMRFSPLAGEERTLMRARAKALGVVPVTWTEYPFDWVRERRYAIRRQLQGGPISNVVVAVELRPVEAGVKVRVAADFTPANIAGRVLWRLGKRPVRDFLAYCDQYLERRSSGEVDPTPLPRRRPSVDVANLDRRLEALARAPIAAALLTPLRKRILEGSDDQVVGLRAYEVADTWAADRAEVLRLFLHATRAGLFELRWELMCPNCRVAKAESPTLRALPEQYHCETCGISWTTEFDQRVELRFTIHPAVRAAGNTVYCTGGPMRAPHVVAQQYLDAGEDRRVEGALVAPLRLRAVGAASRLTLIPDSRPSRGAQDVTLIYAGGRWTGPHSLRTGDDDTLLVPVDAALRIRNQTGGRLLVLLEEIEPSGTATTAAQVTTMQEFRDLFSAEVLAPGQQLAVRDVTLLFSDLRGSTSLYEGVGDAPAYSRVNRHFDFMKERIASRSGTIVKTMGDGLMGAFLRLDDALAAALSMQRDVQAWCASAGIDPPLVLKLGIHHGPVIAMTANDRLDYFGRAVNIAARLGGESQGGDVILTRDVFAEVDRSALESTATVRVEGFNARLRGLQGERELVRLQVAAIDAEAALTDLTGHAAGTASKVGGMSGPVEPKPRVRNPRAGRP